MRNRKRKDNVTVLKYQVVENLNALFSPGVSRHENKFNGDNRIYSYKTFDNYKHFAFHFVDYVVSVDRDVRRLEDAKKYVNDYISSLRNDGYSAYTQKAYLSALRRVFDEPFKDVKTDKRARDGIERGRNETLSNRKFSENKHQDFVSFCQHTGLRRSEVEKLKGGCVSQHADGHFYIDGVKGKGGKIRDVRILNDDASVIDKINNTPQDALVWGLVSKHCNIHGYRADYAQALYQLEARDISSLPRNETYHCKKDYYGLVLDKSSMQIVSQSLGHNRPEVIAENYLYGLL